MIYSYRVILKLSWYSKRVHFTNEVIFFNRYYVNLYFLKILYIIDMQNKQKIFWSKYTQHIPYTGCQLCPRISFIHIKLYEHDWISNSYIYKKNTLLKILIKLRIDNFRGGINSKSDWWSLWYDLRRNGSIHSFCVSSRKLWRWKDLSVLRSPE